MSDVNTTIYEKINQEQLSALELKHNWIVEPIYNASQCVKNMPFFKWLDNIQDPQEFKNAVCQLYYHSDTFPKVMGLMLALTPLSETSMMPFYAKHAYGEADHSAMLMDWMLKNKIINSKDEVYNTIATRETNSCVNYAYQMAIEQDREKWLVGLNSGIERCSNDFFKAISPKMHLLGIGHDYFDVHVEADEHHSIMGLEYIEVHEATSVRGQILIAKALEGIELWASMLHSWIGMTISPKFNLNGELITPVEH